MRRLHLLLLLLILLLALAATAMYIGNPGLLEAQLQQLATATDTATPAVQFLPLVP